MRLPVRMIAAGALVASALPARADNLALEWIDRVTHQVEQDKGPLSKRPLDLGVSGGAFAYYNDNLFLQPNRLDDGDSAVIAFVRGTLDYQDASLTIQADAQVNFDYYMENHSAREDEERFYGKIRWTNGTVDLELAEIARRESDPVDIQFNERARRIVTDTYPRVTVHANETLSFDAFASIQTVRFEGDDFDNRENQNVRAGLGVRYDFMENFGGVVEGGWTKIHYHNARISPPSAHGWFARAGVRGEPMDKLQLEAVAGVVRMRAEETEIGDNHREKHTSFDAEFHARYEVTETLVVSGDYVRRFVFAGGASSYESIDRFTLLASWKATEKLTLRARAQFEHINPTDDPVRHYWSCGVGANYVIVEHVAVDGGVLFRAGNTHNLANDDFTNWVFFVGGIISY